MTKTEELLDFLACTTSDQWVEDALGNIPILLVDHAHCERKAASTAINLMFRYTEFELLQYKMSRLAREELRHYEQVLALLNKREIKFDVMPASNYASALRHKCRTDPKGKLIDVLIVGAFIEARSCERFAKLAPFLDQDLKKFYLSLLKSESRHYKDYLKLASVCAEDSIEDRVAFFREVEEAQIQSVEAEFRFHSGPSR
jgi:tRNA-(ms[2]io[6]A)-hydroxylase